MVRSSDSVSVGLDGLDHGFHVSVRGSHGDSASGGDDVESGIDGLLGSLDGLLNGSLEQGPNGSDVSDQDGLSADLLDSLEGVDLLLDGDSGDSG